MRKLVVALVATLGVFPSTAEAHKKHHHKHHYHYYTREQLLPMALDVARQYWNGRSPCSGHYTANFTPPDGTGRVLGGEADWQTELGAHVYAPHPETWWDCKLEMVDSVWSTAYTQANAALFCQTALHEYGHLLGYDHSTDPTNVMYPVLVASARPAICENFGR